MKRTGPAILLSAALLGAAAGFVLDNALTAWGQPTFTPAPTLPILLVLLGAIVLVLAYGVFRAARGRGGRLDPFRALRIAMLAKASSIVGAAVAGLGIGLLVFVLTRAVAPPLGSLTAVIATAVCGGVLVVAGLIAEQLCTIRKDDDDEQPGAAGPPAARD